MKRRVEGKEVRDVQERKNEDRGEQIGVKKKKRK